MDNPRDTLVTLTRIIQSLYYAPAGRYIKRKCRQRAQYYSSCGNIGYTTLEKTEEAIKNGKSRVTGNINILGTQCYRKLKGQSRMDNPETLATLGTQC
jgi:hypothetical protein